MKNRRRGFTLLLLCLALHGKAAFSTPATLNDGLAAFIRGQYEQAAQLLQSALASKDWPDAAERRSALRALATAQTLSGRYDAAETSVLELLRAGRAPGQADAMLAGDLMLLGGIAKAQGRYDRAETAYQGAIDRLKARYGVDHPEVAEAFRNLADIRYAQRRDSDAELLYSRSYMVASYVGGAQSSLAGRALLGLGLVRQRLGKGDEARELLERALAIADRPPRADGKWGRIDARDLRAMHQEREFVAFRGRIYAREAEPSHPDFAEHLEHRGAILRALNRLEEADGAFRRALEIRRKNFGDRHPLAAYDLRQLDEIDAARRITR